MGIELTKVTISAVIPAHNSKHIGACLRSLLTQQEGRLVEVIVVDDASTDNTVERILEVGSEDPRKRVRLVCLERNSGPSAAKNAGIARAQGSCIAVIDSDMVLERNCLRTLTDVLLESGAAAAMAFFTVPPDMHVLTRVIGYDLEFRLSHVLRGRPWTEVGKVGTGATLFLRHSLTEAGLFEESRRVGEDTALSYRLREKGKKLVIVESAKCMHYWQSRGFREYVSQQVGYGEGILQAYLDARRIPNDPVSSPSMRVNALLAAGSALALLLAPVLPWLLLAALLAVLAQVVIDLPASLWILRKKKDVRACVLAPILFLVRNYSWAASFVSTAFKLSAQRLVRPRRQPTQIANA